MSGGISNILEAATSLLSTDRLGERRKKTTPVDVVFLVQLPGLFQFAVSKICLEKIFQKSSPQDGGEFNGDESHGIESLNKNVSKP